MARMGFGAFLAPHHPIGENPTLQFRRDLKFVEHLDELGYDEFWCGEHHSSGWEMIASPEMFLAAAGERTKRIKLGTGVVSLPYHHPYNVAQRMVQLDHMTGGRAIFGSGPGALPSDAHTLGIDPMTQRDRQDDAIGVIRRLFKGERVTKKTEWYTLQDAALQLLPLQEDMPFVVASQISPSGMTLAGKYGIGIISMGSMSEQGLLSLPTQWGFAEQAAAKKHGTNGRPQELARAAQLARRRDAREGPRGGQARPDALAQRIHRSAPCSGPGDGPFTSPDEAVDKTAFEDGSAAVIGTPDDLVKVIKAVYAKSGGFGTVVGFVHDWANPENTMRSWDMVARYVIPEINGYVAKLRESQKFLIENREVFDARGPGHHGQDHGEQGRRRGAQGHRIAALRGRQRRPAQAPQGERGAGEEGQAAGGRIAGSAGLRPAHDHERAGGPRSRLSRAHPDRGVVERGAAVGRHRIGADQHVDADAVEIGVARPVAFDDDDARARRLRRPRAQAHLAARIAEHAPASPRRRPAAPRPARGSARAARPRAAIEPGVSVKVVLRKPRAGGTTRRNGSSSLACS